MARERAQPARFKLLGGALCLDFTNTVAWYAPDNPRDRFTNYADLVEWGRCTAIISEREAQDLLHESTQRLADAARVFERARTLRAAIHAIFAATAGGLSSDAADLATLNAALSEALSRLCVVPRGSGFAWTWADAEKALDCLLWPVVQSAAELLTSEDLHRVGECPGEGCGWLFVDRSRNRSRRWCDMADCGNRAKVRRHRAARRLPHAQRN